MRALFSRLQFVLSAYRCPTPAVSLLWNVAAYYGIRITETKSGRPNDYATVLRVCQPLHLCLSRLNMENRFLDNW